jgi:hypothetical protein
MNFSMQRKELNRIASFSRFTDNSFLIILSIVTLVVIIDSEVGIIADFISDSLVSSRGLGLFVVTAAVFIIGQYMILKFVKQTNKKYEPRARDLKITEIGARIALYTLAAIFAIITAQIFTTSQYNSSLLMASSLISYGLSIAMFVLLTLRFLSWYRFSSKRNIMVLIFALGMASTFVYSVGGLTTFLGMLQQQPQTVTPEHIAFFPSFEPGTFFAQVQTWYQIAAGVGFVFIWIGVVILLHPYARKFGQAKFWAAMGVALFYHTIQIPLFMLEWYTPSENSNAMTNILVFSIVGIFTGIIFGTAFLSVARAVQKGSALRDNMIIAAYGFLLLMVAGTGTASQAAYPPFGLASVSFVGLAGYLIYRGLYASAISVSQDATIRALIKKSANEQAQLLDSIGRAEMEKELLSKVQRVVKENSESMVRESGIEPSMTDEDVKRYLETVIKELNA